MAKNIALNLTINGVKQSITNIGQLEQAVRDAEEALKGIEIGSKQFVDFSRDVNQAKSVLKDFEKSVEGQELEQRVGAFAKVGESITASFAGAQAAIALFGDESEDVAKAAAQAQSVLTIALAARSAAEGVVAVRTVAANIATFASAQAAKAATTATRVLYTTLAANPYGAILAVIGLVVGALVAFTSETKETINVTKELSQATSQEGDKLRQQFTILTQLNNLRQLQKTTIEDLKKQYPGFNAFIDKENKLTADGIKFLSLKIKQYELEAQAKLIVQKIAENNLKILEIENTTILDNVSFWEKAFNVIRSGGSISGGLLLNYQTGLKNTQAQTKEITDQNELWRKSLNNVYTQTDVVLKQLVPFETALTNQVVTEKNLVTAKENAIRTQEELNNAYKKGLTSSIDLSKAIEQLNKVFKQYEQTLSNLSTIKYDIQVLDQLKNIQEARKAAAKELVDGTKQIERDLKQIGTELILPDSITVLFRELRDKLESEFKLIGTKSFKGFEKVYKDFIDNITKNGGKLSVEQENILQSIAKGYTDLGSILENTAGFNEYLKNLTGVNVAWDDFRGGSAKAYDSAEAFMMIIGEVTAANKTFINEFKTSGLGSMAGNLFPEIEPLKFDLGKVQSNSRQYIQELEKQLFKPIAERLVQQELKIQQELLKSTTDPLVRSEISGRIATLVKQIDSVRKSGLLVAEFSQTTTQQVQTEVTKIVDEIFKFSTALTSAEQKIIAVNKEVSTLFNDLYYNQTNLSAAIGGVVLQNIDAISNLLLGTRNKEATIEKEFVEKVKKDRKGLQDFKDKLIEQGFHVYDSSLDDLLQAYIAYKRKEVDVDKKAEKEKQDARTKTFQDIQRGFEIFSTTLNQISALSRERVLTDLEGLQMIQKKTLALVVGDSEAAAAKRLEIQTEYEQKAKEIEKKGRIDSLKFSLVQAIANGAQAFVKSLAELGPILGPILAGVNAALTLSQVVIIQDQIANAQAMRRGGLVKAQGGMLLSGPTHEQGGIPLAQMGVIAEGQEAIINRQSTVNFRDLLSTINQSGGGRPLVVNNFDDSRIVEAIASQKQKPLRAYVLQSEITNEQAISKRLDDLSKI